LGSDQAITAQWFVAKIAAGRQTISRDLSKRVRSGKRWFRRDRGPGQ
jgi:hypothetical protein